MSDDLRAHLLAVADHAELLAGWTVHRGEAARELDNALTDASVAPPGEVTTAVLTQSLLAAEVAIRVAARLEETAPTMTDELLTDAHRRIVNNLAQAQANLGTVAIPAYTAALNGVYDGSSTEVPVRLRGDVAAEEVYRHTRALVANWTDDLDRFNVDLAGLPLAAALTTATALLVRAAELRLEVDAANNTITAANQARAVEGV